MAITKKYKEQLEALLLIKTNWLPTEIIEKLCVAPNWVSRNREELTSLGFNLIRKGREDVGKPRRESLMLSEIVSDLSLSDLHYYNCLLLKYYINKAYVYYGLVAPFQLESTFFRNKTVTSDVLDILDNRIISENFDYRKLLREVVETSDVNSNIFYTKFPVNVTVYLKTLYDSLVLLEPVDVPDDLKQIVKNTFNDLFKLEPTEEQYQVVVKSLRYAASPSSYKSVSIQSDARI